MILPFAKSIYLCDGCIGYPGGKTDIMGLFNSVRPSAYPHTLSTFVVFAQLTGGLGRVPCYVDIQYPAASQLVRTTYLKMLPFPHRKSVVQLAFTIQDCVFNRPGVYLVELYCDAQLIADVSFELI